MNQEKNKPDPLKNRLSNFRRFSKTPEAHSFAWLSLTIFVISFFLIVAIKPTLVTVASLNRERKEKEEANQKLEAKIKNLIVAQDEFVKNSENIFLLDEALPKNSQFSYLAYFFEENAQSFQLNINSLTFEKINPSVAWPNKTLVFPLSFFNFSLSLSGDFPNLKNYIDRLEFFRRIIKIDSVAFRQVKSKKQEEETEEKISVNISGKVFFEKDSL